MICEDREEIIARLEWQETKVAIRRQKEIMTICGANVDRKAALSLLKLRARMWRKMVPMNVVFSGTWGPHYECPSCHAVVYKDTVIVMPQRYCRWCGQRLSWRQIIGK